MLSLWANLPASIRGFIRIIIATIVFAGLDAISKNIGLLGLSPYLSALVTGIIGALENHQTSVAVAQANASIAQAKMR